MPHTCRDDSSSTICRTACSKADKACNNPSPGLASHNPSPGLSTTGDQDDATPETWERLACCAMYLGLCLLGQILQCHPTQRPPGLQLEAAELLPGCLRALASQCPYLQDPPAEHTCSIAYLLGSKHLFGTWQLAWHAKCRPQVASLMTCQRSPVCLAQPHLAYLVSAWLYRRQWCCAAPRCQQKFMDKQVATESKAYSAVEGAGSFHCSSSRSMELLRLVTRVASAASCCSLRVRTCMPTGGVNPMQHSV